MKKFTIMAAICLLLLGLAAPNVSATIINTASTSYLGQVVPGQPVTDTDEAAFINKMITLSSGGTATVTIASFNNQLTRSTNGPFTGLPTATTAGDLRSGANPPNTGINTAGWIYLVAKYDGANGGDYIWYLNKGVSSADIPHTFNGQSNRTLTSYTLFKTVPDGGMTLMLLGGALVAVETMRRKLRV